MSSASLSLISPALLRRDWMWMDGRTEGILWSAVRLTLTWFYFAGVELSGSILGGFATLLLAGECFGGRSHRRVKMTLKESKENSKQDNKHITYSILLIIFLSLKLPIPGLNSIGASYPFIILRHMHYALTRTPCFSCLAFNLACLLLTSSTSS